MKRALFIPLFFFAAAPVFGAAFGGGNLVVVQDGAGSVALSGAATAAFLDEFTTAGAVAQPAIPLPTAVSGANKILTLAGSSTSEGFLTLSADGQYLTVGGYNQVVGTATPNTLIGNRTVARVDMLGNIDTTTILGDGASIGNIRSVVSDNGTGIWVGSSASGMRYTTFGSTGPSTQLNTTPVNVRVANIASGQLYVSSASLTFQGVATVGSGLPTTSGQTVTLLSGFPTATGPSSYDYLFANSSTLYVADDRGTATGGGLQKWTLSGGTWSLAYTLTNALTAGLRGLTGVADGAGNELLYATTADATSGTAGNKLVGITDSLGATTLPGAEVFATIATAAGNTAFRGVEMIPVVPEPQSLALFGGFGMLAWSFIRRRK